MDEEQQKCVIIEFNTNRDVTDLSVLGHDAGTLENKNTTRLHDVKVQKVQAVE